MNLSSRLVTFLIAALAVPVVAAALVFFVDARRAPLERAEARLETAREALSAWDEPTTDPLEARRRSGLDATVVEGAPDDLRVLDSTLAVQRGTSVVAHSNRGRGGSIWQGSIGDRRVLAAEAGPQLMISVDLDPLESQGVAAARTRLLGIVGVCLLAVAAGWFLGRRLTGSLGRVAAESERIAAGGWRSGERATGEGADEVGRIGSAVNSLAALLRTSDREVRRSRDDRVSGLVSFGAMLEATHDRDAVLTLVADLSRRDVGARGAALFLVTRQRSWLEVVYVEGFCGGLRVGDRLAVGQGLAGAVAESGWAECARRRGDPAGLNTVAPEPVGDALAAPIRAEGRIYGVLALYGRVEGPPFDEGDIALVAEFARQAGVGVDNVLSYEEAERMAIRDPVTSSWNRHYFDIALAREIERAVRFGHDLGLVMFDLDDFKELNDTFGHPAGDDVLAQVSRLVTGLIREADVLARYGGEEFVVILVETDIAGSVVVAEKIRAGVEESVFPAGARRARTTVSVGVAAFPAHATSPSLLVAAADQALYEAKRLGKNRVRSAAGPAPLGQAGPGSARGRGPVS